MDERPDPPAVLASDAEREHGLVVLRDAVVEGRLTLEEFSERVGQVQLARTDRDLAALTADLPAAPVTSAEIEPVKHRATFSRLVRSGAWELPRRSSWRCLFGTVVLDLRAARLSGDDSELAIFNLFGTVTVIVPPGVDVAVDGGGAFASQVISPPPWPAPPQAPRLRIHASGPGGTLYVRTSDDDKALRRQLGRGS